MVVSIVQNGPIPNYYTGLNAARRTAAQNVIAQLQYADLWRGAGTLYTNDLMRIDMQGLIPAHGGTPAQSNIQVQVNGVTGHSTVAHANVSYSLNGITNAENQQGAANQVISALNRSLDSGYSYSVTGTLP